MISILGSSTLCFLVCHYYVEKNMKEKKEKNKTNNDNVTVREFFFVFFLLHVWEVSLSSASALWGGYPYLLFTDLLFFLFFCSQHIRGRSTLLATGHAPSWPLSTHIDGSLLAAWMSGSRRGVTCCERGLLSLKALPQTNKDNSCSTLYPQPEPNIAYGLPSFPLVGAAVVVVGVGSAGANACIHLF